MSSSTREHNCILLSGLDGGNPLAFLAALGTLRTLCRALPGQALALSWKIHGGMWTPSVHSHLAMTNESLIDTLVQSLQSDAAKHPIAFMITGEEAKTATLFSERASRAASTDRDALDLLSAMRSELAPEASTQLQLVRRDYFPGNLKSVISRCKAEHLHRSLFHAWDYADPLDNQSLHFEPSEDRRHAHQWSEPSGDPDRKKRGGMLGANRLSIEAFPFFQSIAIGEKLATRGFSGRYKDDTRWTWPIWTCPIGADVIGSLLSLRELQSESLDHGVLSARGIQAAFRCRRILVGKTPNLTPAMAV
jgi:CRISPR-associated endonuclease/helicase Cas3